jgi:hypothetical protein
MSLLTTVSVLLFFSAHAGAVTHPLLSVLQPSSLITKYFSENPRGGLNATLAYYGHLSYGQEQLTRLFVPVNGGNQDGCNEFKMTDFIREPAAVDSVGA